MAVIFHGYWHGYKRLRPFNFEGDLPKQARKDNKGGLLGESLRELGVNISDYAPTNRLFPRSGENSAYFP